MEIPVEILWEEQISGFRVICTRPAETEEENKGREIALVRRMLKLLEVQPAKP